MSPRAGSSDSSSVGPLSAKKGWELVLGNEHQLPTFHTLMFDMLGVSQQLLAWLAVYAAGETAIRAGLQRTTAYPYQC